MENLLTPGFWEELATDGFTWLITVLPRLLLILIIAAVVMRLANVLLKRLRPMVLGRLQRGGALEEGGELDKRLETLFGILRSVIKVFLWLILLMLLLRQLGIDIAPIIAGAGILGLAVGFGAQELVRDFISGFFLLLENQVRAGDVAVINGTGGVVENVGLRTIVLRDLSGTVHVVQNGKINSLSNMTKEWSAIVFDIGVAYDSDIDQVIQVMRETDEELRGDQKFSALILEPMEVFGVDAFGANEIVIKGRIKTRPVQQWTVGREYRRRLKAAFDRSGIEIPFPQRTLHFRPDLDLSKLTG
ncbi:MAG: mechanosensitive ion channel family protein [Alkalispirochaetaceae bacterium]